MAYEKRVCVLKQVRKGFSADGGIVSGAVYAERMGEELTVTPRVTGLAPVKEGNYALALWLDGTVSIAALRGNEPLKIGPSPSIKGGFSALLCFVRGEAEPIAYGFCGSAPASYQTLLSSFTAEKKERRRAIPTPLPPNELPAPVFPNVPAAPGVPLPGPDPDEEKEAEERPFREENAYDDEAIAASDYFSAAADEDGGAPGGGAGEGETAHGDGHLGADAPAPLFPRGTLTYYNEVRERLEEAFARYPRDERLNQAFPQSEWVSSGNALLGVIYENGQPRYLCVAAEGTEPPAEMKEHAVFVPATPFSDEAGFWVVFQDADTGEYASVKDA